MRSKSTFLCLDGPTMIVLISTGLMQLDSPWPVIAHQPTVWARYCLSTSRGKEWVILFSLLFKQLVSAKPRSTRNGWMLWFCMSIYINGTAPMEDFNLPWLQWWDALTRLIKTAPITPTTLRILMEQSWTCISRINGDKARQRSPTSYFNSDWSSRASSSYSRQCISLEAAIAVNWLLPPATRQRPELVDVELVRNPLHHHDTRKRQLVVSPSSPCHSSPSTISSNIAAKRTQHCNKTEDCWMGELQGTNINWWHHFIAQWCRFGII